ncbi:hypothetical protein BJ986_002132 [Phycicoccus badiiscoriae]|uniref:Glycosyltransferase RgtA/B/C/D-like domain-containing protein n=1 Tax=Pedococcus badiiscoriae TaxID=642776 RepID=A0A852WN39_9MICO|nr:hypothetical protein [Pedococcus badiiscoriae]NYG07645.1 hypothetical protein [Pedococcus badiiscoriae]
MSRVPAQRETGLRVHRKREVSPLRRQAQARVLAALVVAVTFAVTYTSTVKLRPLFAPDSRYYAGMALWFGGESQAEAARQVAEVSAKSGWASPAASVLFGWGLVQPRVVLPALSVPFVKLWGIDGLVVVPGLALAALIGLMAWQLSRRYGTVAALGAVVLIMCSPQIMFYGSAMLTESLSALWGALTLAAAWRYQRRPGWAPVAAMVGLTLVSAFTRQSTLIVAGAFVVAWLAALVLRHRPNGWGVAALAVGGTSVVAQVVQTVLFPTFSQLDQFKTKTGADSLSGALLAAPRLAWHIARTDVKTFALADRPLLVLVALCILSGLVFWRREETHLLLGAFAGTELYGVTNGTPTAFRYAMPGLVFFALSLALLFSRAVQRTGQPARTDDLEPGRESPLEPGGESPRRTVSSGQGQRGVA